MSSENDKKTKKGRLECEFSTSDVRDDFITSKKYSIDGICDSEFFIQAHYTVRDRKLQIIVCKTKSEIIYADISVIVTQNDRRRGKLIEECILWKENYSFIFESIMLNSSTWEVICDITLFNSMETMNSPILLSNLHNDVKPFLLSSKLSDFTIVIGGEELPVHKFVLGAQSSVFFSMFESNMEGPKTNRLIIEDISVNTMKNVLAYLYTRSIEALKNPQIALQMLIAAKMYNIIKLKDLCEDSLINQIAKWNLLEILKQATTHNFEKLQDACFKFIAENE